MIVPIFDTERDSAGGWTGAGQRLGHRRARLGRDLERAKPSCQNRSAQRGQRQRRGGCHAADAVEPHQEGESERLIRMFDLPTDRPLRKLSRGMRMKAALLSSP